MEIYVNKSANRAVARVGALCLRLTGVWGGLLVSKSTPSAVRRAARKAANGVNGWGPYDANAHGWWEHAACEDIAAGATGHGHWRAEDHLARIGEEIPSWQSVGVRERAIDTVHTIACSRCGERFDVASGNDPVARHLIRQHEEDCWRS